jgi:hypothetical protein
MVCKNQGQPSGTHLPDLAVRSLWAPIRARHLVEMRSQGRRWREKPRLGAGWNSGTPGTQQDVLPSRATQGAPRRDDVIHRLRGGLASVRR